MHPTDLAPLQKVFGERKANNHRSRKLKTEQVIPLRCWNPHKALASLVLLNKTGKKCFSQREIYCCRDFSPHRTRVTAKHGEGTVCSQRWESSLPSLRAAGGLRIEVSLGTWGPDPVLIELFATQNRREFPTRKKSSRNRLGSHVPSKTSRRKPPTVRPSNLEARTLRLVEHTFPKFGVDTCPVRRGITAAWSAMSEKNVFPCVASEQKWRLTTDGTARGFQYDEGKICLVFRFRVR